MLPKTSPQHYLTGMTALNIPCPDEGYGDWHFYEAFFGRGDIQPKVFVAGEDTELNTLPLFGDFGIHECGEILREKGVPLPANEKVFAAGHYRAVLDMLYRCLSQEHYPYHIDIDEWFDTSEQRLELIKKIETLLLPRLDKKKQDILTKWLLHQASKI